MLEELNQLNMLNGIECLSLAYPVRRPGDKPEAVSESLRM